MKLVITINTFLAILLCTGSLAAKEKVIIVSEEIETFTEQDGKGFIGISLVLFTISTLLKRLLSLTRGEKMLESGSADISDSSVQGRYTRGLTR